jgi:uncharacterized protein YgiM (DUF1202 family)
MLVVFNRIKKLIQLLTIFLLLMGWWVNSSAKVDDLYDKTALIFFEVINVVDDDVLYIREFPSSQSRKVGYIPPHQSCVVYLNQLREKNSQTWVAITYKGVKGWVNLYHLRQLPSGECPNRYYKVINVREDDVLNMRDIASHNGRKIGQIPPDESCLPQLDQSYASNSQKWVMVRYKNIKGWVNSYFLKTDKSACR